MSFLKSLFGSGAQKAFDRAKKAIAKGDMDALKSIIDAAPDLLEVGDSDQNSLLHEACLYRNEGIVEMLLERGADIHRKGKLGQTAIQFASYCGRYQMVELLVARGADPNASSTLGMTPIICVLNALAALEDFARKSPEVAAVLLVEGPLTLATLISCGADVDAAGTLLFTERPLAHLRERRRKYDPKIFEVLESTLLRAGAKE